MFELSITAILPGNAKASITGKSYSTRDDALESAFTMSLGFSDMAREHVQDFLNSAIDGQQTPQNRLDALVSDLYVNSGVTLTYTIEEV